MEFNDIKIGQVLIKRDNGEKFICIYKETNDQDDFYSYIKIISELHYKTFIGKTVIMENLKHHVTVQNGCDGIEDEFEITDEIVDVSVAYIVSFGGKSNYSFSNSKNITIGDYIQLYDFNDKTEISIVDINSEEDEILFHGRIDYLQCTSEGIMHDLSNLLIDHFGDNDYIFVNAKNYTGRKGIY